METAMGSDVTQVWLGADAMITALGNSTDEALTAIFEGRVGCHTVNDPTLWPHPFVAGMVDFPNARWKFPSMKRRGGSRIATDGVVTPLEQMFISAIGRVLERSGVDPGATDTGLVMASTKGNIELLGGLGEMAATVASACGFAATPVVISNACISGVSALIVAARLIREGNYRNVVVAGGDTLSRFVVSGFHAFRSVSPTVCRPYDASRDGLTLGEGCGAILLTADSAKAVQPAVELAGGAISGDANHISGPSRTGDGLCFALRDAMTEARVAPAEVGMVNGHGTGTIYNDEMESKAFALAFERAGFSTTSHAAVFGLKPWFGHTLGASGVVETIVAAHALRRGTVPATPGFSTPGTPHPLDVSPHNRPTTTNVCVKTASGFGGCNAAVVLKKTEVPQVPKPAGAQIPLPDKEGWQPRAAKVVETASATIRPDGRPFAEMIRQRFKALDSPDMKFFKMDDLSRLAYIASCELLAGTHLAERHSPDRIGIILANRSASLDTDRRHHSQIAETPTDASPAVFVYTLPNVAAGEIAIRHKIQGESTFFIDNSPTRAENYARMLLRRGVVDAAICGWCELDGENFAAEFKLLELK
jgi:3-oxoacyl-(acyl-carrier-protein) synthase